MKRYYFKFKTFLKILHKVVYFNNIIIISNFIINILDLVTFNLSI